MSIAVLIGVHDGLVMAADSASTLTISTSPGITAGVANVYDNANKIFNLYKGRRLGCVTFGAGSIGNSSIGTLIKDLRSELMDVDRAKAHGFDPDNYTMEGVSNIVGKFLGEKCAELKSPSSSNINIGLLLGGYSTGQSLGESWSVEIQAGQHTKPTQLRQPDMPGISWGGLGEALQRIVLGFSPLLPQILEEVRKGDIENEDDATRAQLMGQLNQLLMARLQAPFVFAPMPIQDAIDLSRFLVHASIMFSRFTPGPQMVGGPIEIAAITKHEGFKWISRKHYYEASFNKEPQHVVIDRSEKD